MYIIIINIRNFEIPGGGQNLERRNVEYIEILKLRILK